MSLNYYFQIKSDTYDTNKEIILYVNDNIIICHGHNFLNKVCKEQKIKEVRELPKRTTTHW